MGFLRKNLIYVSKLLVEILQQCDYTYSLRFMFRTNSSETICFSFINVHFLSCRLFEEHTELIELFEKFRELKTKEQQATSEELAEHANKVMETLDEGIRSLDELDVFFQYLHDVGASHTRIPGKVNWILNWK